MPSAALDNENFIVFFGEGFADATLAGLMDAGIQRRGKIRRNKSNDDRNNFIGRAFLYNLTMHIIKTRGRSYFMRACFIYFEKTSHSLKLKIYK
jgi:hypothetical protein